MFKLKYMWLLFLIPPLIVLCSLPLTRILPTPMPLWAILKIVSCCCCSCACCSVCN